MFYFLILIEISIIFIDWVIITEKLLKKGVEVEHLQRPSLAVEVPDI